MQQMLFAKKTAMAVAIGLALSGRWVAAIILGAIGVLVIGTVDNLLRPMFSRYGQLKLPTFVLFLAIFGGIALYGAAGIILGPLLVRLGVEALNLALRAVADPGDTIAVESPTFYGLLQVLESLGMRALEIPTSPQTGISLDALEMAMQTYDNIKAVVVVPHLQNPLGSIMPDAHKQGLVQLCENHGVALIEDDTYSELVNEATRGDTPLRAMKSWDTTGNVIYCASLHKILAPGIRIGWMAAGRWQARVEMLKFTQTRSNEELSQLAVAVPMCILYEIGIWAAQLFIKHTIASYFPEGTRLNVPDGGLSLWVELPHKLSSRRVFDAALAQQILVTPGQMFSNTLRFDPYLRINCGWPHQQDVEQGLRRLGQIVTELVE